MEEGGRTNNAAVIHVPLVEDGVEGLDLVNEGARAQQNRGDHPVGPRTQS